jgi:hypothetical protein
MEETLRSTRIWSNLRGFEFYFILREKFPLCVYFQNWSHASLTIHCGV